MSTAEFEDYDAFNNRRRKSQRDTILTVEVTCVLSWFILRKVNMVSRNQQCSDDYGITNKSRDWSEKA